MRERIEKNPLARSAVGERERELWLSSQLAKPPRLLPGELPDGRPAPNAPLDALVLDPEEVPAGDTGTVGPGPLICPLDLRPRAAAALVGFLSTTGAVLRKAMFTKTDDELRNHANTVMADANQGAVHMVSSTWTVPLPWFALVDPAARVLNAETEDTPQESYWLGAMADVRRRTARAHAVAKEALGDEGPTAVLRDTGRWLERFHPHSAVELDYGGIAGLLPFADLEADTSVQDVHAIVDAMEAGDPEAIATHYDKLREFWALMAAHERFN
ncbi:MAG TPA: hypothetical protein VJ914_24365 [Pseudonocardiaceae bacterium]|nr:hypothetical protein [Pseudonocardiaceae bacterium]